MATPIVMPQMGESIAEGTIVRWIKKVGDPVERDEPLLEITTDKVDAEIPSPVAGVLTEIKAREGETVTVNSVIGTIVSADEALAPVPSKSAAAQVNGTATAAETPSRRDSEPPRQRAAVGGTPPAAIPSREELRRHKSSPVVRRIARENDVDISQMAGSGIGGRVTKQDILQYLGRGVQGSGIGARKDPEPTGTPLPVSRPPIPGPQSPIPGAAERVQIEPLSIMRKKIAEHMVLSRRTSAHVHSVFHVNFSHVEKLRNEKKDDYARLGARLTYLAFIAKAVVDALRRHPIVNASLEGDSVVYHRDVHLGIAVALESGLIVPVIRNADERNLLGLSRAIADLGDRARAKQLRPEEVRDGTFTITNPGQFGAQFGMPIINQPQVAILGVGTIERRPIVVDDALAIRMMGYLTLGFDHRLIDGAVADQFMSDVKKQIEEFDPNQV